jgi:hypothetical protein
VHVQRDCHRDRGKHHFPDTEGARAFGAEMGERHGTETRRHGHGEQIGGLQGVAVLEADVLSLLRVAVGDLPCR